MNDAKSYVAPFKINEPLEGGVVATVVESKSDNFKVGDTVVGTSMEENILAKKIKYKSRFKHSELSYYLSILDDFNCLFWVDGYLNQRPGKLS
jgi:NADPH-dependent curcumin reductase CurA